MLKRTNFKSPDIFDFSIRFIADTNYSRRYHNKINLILLSIFKDVETNKINKDFIVSAISKEVITTTKDINILLDILVHFIDNGITFLDCELLKTCFPLIIDTNLNFSTKLNTVMIILTNPRVINYYDCGIISDKKSLSVTLTFVKPNHFFDSSDAIILDDFLDSKKLDPEITLHTVYAAIQSTNAIVKKIFSKKPLRELTRYDISDFFVSYTGGNSETRCLLSLCFFLVKINYYNDSRLSFLEVISPSYLVKFGYEKWIEILSHPNPYNYRYIKYHFNNSDRLYTHLINFNCNTIEIIDVLVGYLEIKRFVSTNIKDFCEKFNNSLGQLIIDNVGDFNYATFMQQVGYICKNYDKTVMSFLVGLYTHISINFNPQLFDKAGYNPSILLRQALSGELFQGYMIIPFNPYESPPNSDKLLFYQNESASVNTSNNTTKLFSFDFSAIKYKPYRDWVKRYIWSETGFADKRSSLLQSVYFCNFIYSLKRGDVLSIYCKKTNNMTITIMDVQAFINDCTSMGYTDSTTFAYVNNAKNFLSFIVNNNGVIVKPSTIFHLSSYAAISTSENKIALSDDELSRLSLEIKKSVEVSYENVLYASIFRLMIETELRLSHILALKIGCVIPSHKSNEYILISFEKTSNREPKSIPIPLMIKEFIEELISFTQPQRILSTNEHIKSHIFISNGHKVNSTRIINADNFRKFLSKCCSNCNIKNFTPKDLRVTHMTKSQKYIIKESLSELELSVLTGHNNKDTTLQNYVDWGLLEVIEVANKLTIGDFTVPGQIKRDVSTDLKTTENLVYHQCGYCENKHCSNFTFIACLLCPSFIATLDRIPFFNFQIKVTDFKLDNCLIPSEKETHTKIKKLLSGYLYNLLDLQKG